MKFRFFGGVVVLVGLLASLAGCGGGGSASGGSQVTATATGATLLYVVVTPEPVPVLPLGGNQQFVATGYYSDGTTQNLSSSASWTSSSTATATISASGAATAVAVGTTKITATVGGITSLPVTLSTMQATLVSVTISSTNPSSIAVGQPTQFTAQGTYSNGFTQDITPAVDWISGTASVASIQTYITSTPGLATGQVPGTTVIYAMDPLTGKTSATFNLTVTNTYAVGGTISLLPAGASVTLLDTIVTSGVTTTDTLTINADGRFTLPTALAPGANYNVTVSSASLPAGAHACTVLDGAGTINATTPAAALNLQLVCGPAVGTLAGSAGQTGTQDGIGQSAQFSSPRGVAVNTLTGDVYVADGMNNNIRAISLSGMVTTLAGSTTGVAGYNDNTAGTLATFRGPEGLAFDPKIGTAGTLYVADSSNNVIRKIDIATTMVTTLAGSGSWGNANGTGTSASFYYPTELAVDTSDNVYVADTSNNSIRKVTSGGTVSTLAGAGTFNGPQGVAVNSTTGVVYVSDSNNQVLKTISGTTVSVFAGRVQISGDVDGTGTDALFYNPAYLAIDAQGNVYVTDDGNAKLRKVTPAGVVTTVVGHGVYAAQVDGPVSLATVTQPWGLAADAAGNLYTTDVAGTDVRKYTP